MKVKVWGARGSIPAEVRELPCHLSFRDSPTTEWKIGTATIQAAAVTHRGPTLGYRITDGGQSICYIPDHEPALGASLEDLEEEWISGFELARGADLLIHDCQYTDDEYPSHLGWGHTKLTDALTLARRAEAGKVLLFHHHPLHSGDFLDALAGAACEKWEGLGGRADSLELAVERRELVLAAAPAR